MLNYQIVSWFKKRPSSPCEPGGYEICPAWKQRGKKYLCAAFNKLYQSYENRNNPGRKKPT